MKIDLAKRKAVMQRSMLLGHCICDPRRPCPCDVFTNEGICPCAGEKAEPGPRSEVKLTAFARNPGCASKIPATDLSTILSGLKQRPDPNVLSGLAAADDAAVYKLDEGLALVQTVDVFTPCVDDPAQFGRICAANCVSDIYAMGGTPRTALSILAFPSERIDPAVGNAMLAGAIEKLEEAGVSLIGGHSVKDEEVKLGFAVTGTIDPALVDALDNPRPGDVLVLTKPLGTGVLAFAAQIGRVRPEALAQSAASMAQLNRDAAEAMLRARASACTDITGFGLFTHLHRMLRSASAVIWLGALPAFDDVIDLLRQQVIPGAIERNREYVSQWLILDRGTDEARVNLGLDAQTSGGLLIAIHPERAQALLDDLARRGVPGFAVGEVVSGEPGVIRLQAGKNVESAGTMKSQEPTVTVQACCQTGATEPNGAGPGAAFAALMRAVQAPGTLDARTKEIVVFALVLQSRCEACCEAHMKKARAMGITEAELSEAAWCAIAMGGAPVKMFCEEHGVRL